MKDLEEKKREILSSSYKDIQKLFFMNYNTNLKLNQIFFSNFPIQDKINQVKNIEVSHIKGIKEFNRILKNKSAKEKVILGKEIYLSKEKLKFKIVAIHKQFLIELNDIRNKQETLDVTMDKRKFWKRGSIHPLSQTIERIYSIFYNFGFHIAEGYEIEKEYYNFDALNIPSYHPSRKDQDSFYIRKRDISFNSEKELLRTQMTPIQIRILEIFKKIKNTYSISVISVGRCFRKDNMDATHSHTFHQLEGIFIDKGTNFSHLKGLLDLFIKEFFNKPLKSRFKADFFPFTRPSAEYAIECFFCDPINKKSKKEKINICSICKNSKWLEIGGCGMIHKNILEKANIDSNIYSGYAFGIGIERLAMLAFNIPDIRLFYENNLRFLMQF